MIFFHSAALVSLPPLCCDAPSGYMQTAHNTRTGSPKETGVKVRVKQVLSTKGYSFLLRNKGFVSVVMIPIILRFYFLQSPETRSAPNRVISLIITFAPKGSSPMRLKVLLCKICRSHKAAPSQAIWQPKQRTASCPFLLLYCSYRNYAANCPESCDHNTTGIPKLRLAIPLSCLVLYVKHCFIGIIAWGCEEKSGRGPL